MSPCNKFQQPAIDIALVFALFLSNKSDVRFISGYHLTKDLAGKNKNAILIILE
jgi:hypothetical protein